MSTTPGFAQRLKLIVQMFRRWRKSRPFWAGFFTLLSGLIILAPPYASLKLGEMVISVSTIGGVSALLIGVIMIICAISLWTRHQFRFVAGVVAMILALIALVTVNLGSFLIGTILGLIGGGLAIAWTDRGSASAGEDDGTKPGKATAEAGTDTPTVMQPAVRPEQGQSRTPPQQGQSRTPPQQGQSRTPPQQGQPGSPPPGSGRPGAQEPGGYAPRDQQGWSQPSRPDWQQQQPQGRSR